MHKEENIKQLWDTSIMFLLETVNSHWSNKSKADIPTSKWKIQIAKDLQKHKKNIWEWKRRKDYASYVNTFLKHR